MRAGLRLYIPSFTIGHSGGFSLLSSCLLDSLVLFWPDVFVVRCPTGMASNFKRVLRLLEAQAVPREKLTTKEARDFRCHRMWLHVKWCLYFEYCWRLWVEIQENAGTTCMQHLESNKEPLGFVCAYTSVSLPAIRFEERIAQSLIQLCHDITVYDLLRLSLPARLSSTAGAGLRSSRVAIPPTPGGWRGAMTSATFTSCSDRWEFKLGLPCSC